MNITSDMTENTHYWNMTMTSDAKNIVEMVCKGDRKLVVMSHYQSVEASGHTKNETHTGVLTWWRLNQ